MYKSSLFHTVFLFQTDDITYKAVVVEYAPVGNSLQNYLNIVNEADNVSKYKRCSYITVSTKFQQTDIIIFPEATLTGSYTFVPDANSNTVPCTSTEEYEDYLKQLSCAAADKRVYIVANVKEKAICTAETQATIGDKRPCASNGYSLYNTNVAFDRTGTVVARYINTRCMTGGGIIILFAITELALGIQYL